MGSDWSDSVKEDLKELFGSGTSVSGDSREGGGTLWSTYYDGCETDIQEINDMRIRCWPDPIDADKAVEWVKDKRREAATRYNTCLSVWNGTGGFAKDIEYISGMEHNKDRWLDNVWAPIRHDGEDTADSKVLKSWHGPGAQAYAQVLQKQTMAMAEYANLAQTSKGWIEQINNTVKGIAMGAKNYVDSLNAEIGNCQSSDEYVGIRASVGYYNFGYLEEWLTELKTSGNWKDTFQTLKYDIEDAFRDTSFKDGKWPEAKADDIGDMTNGNAGLGDQQPELPPAQDPNQQASTPPTPEQAGDVDTHGTDERDGTNEFNK